jgi:hypothetical protein
MIDAGPHARASNPRHCRANHLRERSLLRFMARREMSNKSGADSSCGNNFICQNDCSVSGSLFLAQSEVYFRWHHLPP